MTKLKTLKDLDAWTDEWHDVVKQEAIKWVKHIRSSGLDSKYTMENDFTKFFNITEEDLK